MRHRLQATLLDILAVLLLTVGYATAVAASLSVGALRLEYAPPWQRAGADEEDRLESAVLRQEGAADALMLLLPRHHPRLRLSPERYFEQLETIWRFQYGKEARIDWLEAGGRRWRMLRRPSLERADAVVFQLVTVIDGQAHHLLAYAPQTALELPEPVLRLVKDMATGPQACPRCAPSAPADAGQDAGHGATSAAVDSAGQAAAAAASPASPAPVAPTASWRLERVLRIRPGPSDLDQLFATEQRALRADGGITGIALEEAEHGLKAFIEGFVWEEATQRRPEKRAFAHRWELAWDPPPEAWQEGQPAVIVARAGADSDPLRLRIGLHFVCGPAEQLRQLLEAAPRPQDDIGARLQAGHDACRGPVGGLTQTEVSLSAGQTARGIALMPPAAAGPSEDEPGRLVLTLQPRIGSGTGQALLGSASFHYVYRRQLSKDP